MIPQQRCRPARRHECYTFVQVLQSAERQTLDLGQPDQTQVKNCRSLPVLVSVIPSFHSTTCLAHNKPLPLHPPPPQDEDRSFRRCCRHGPRCYHRPECSTLTRVVTFLPLLTDANTCASNTGYSLYPFTGLPTAEEITLICADTTCTKVLSEAAALDLPDCTVTYNAVAYNVKDQITLYATACGAARK
ncbi:hypothetical protein PHYSODRAFT_529135 [Phytophthora sojae]|uniref:Elicitin n=2 Tax=Phytophthora sojae TaxID=67593 RepID=G5AB70_PHYSP|nr:hypothetical protein PHYSODRAFT_529135 [Phytophthora sojae]ABB56002.1 elicitin-like protein SOL10 [Phytophthora sojae]EGZ07215.1 hypothetical protein PHYSODRAFT_529135 [Phytophthora sojae]|eukprot:XP_009536781.1 hypothetical protein PHYSODRAFT_529135 [Phytophthora sojae]